MTTMLMRFAPALILVLLTAACSADDSKTEAPAASTPPATETAAAPAPAAAPTELVITDITEGQGNAVQAGQIAVVHYTGWLFDPAAAETKGEKFDSSLDRNEPFAVPLGAGQVIAGWDQGVPGMKVGGKRRLTIPPHLGYGDSGAGDVIPPGATLVFDVELVRIEGAPAS
jgi:FKBP-type peptidyl-prolyl cis-trans isomerase FkpA